MSPARVAFSGAVSLCMVRPPFPSLIRFRPPVTPVLIVLLGIAWVAYTAFFLYARRGAEDVLRRWGEATGHRIVEARRAKFTMLNPHLMLNVSSMQRLFEIRVAQKDGSRRVMVLSVGDRWLGSLRDAVTVVEDDGRQVKVEWRGDR